MISLFPGQSEDRRGAASSVSLDDQKAAVYVHRSRRQVGKVKRGIQGNLGTQSRELRVSSACIDAEITYPRRLPVPPLVVFLAESEYEFAVFARDSCVACDLS